MYSAVQKFAKWMQSLNKLSLLTVWKGAQPCIHFREEKRRFMEELTADSGIDDEVLTAVSLGVGFLEKNYSSDCCIPIVVCAYSQKQNQTTLT